MDDIRFKPEFLEIAQHAQPAPAAQQQKISKKTDIINKLKDNKVYVIAAIAILVVLIIVLIYVLFKGKKPKLPQQQPPGKPQQAQQPPPVPPSQQSQQQPQQPPASAAPQQPAQQHQQHQQQKKVMFTEPPEPLGTVNKKTDETTSFDKLVGSIDDKELNKYINSENQAKLEAKKQVEDNIEISDEDEEPPQTAAPGELEELEDSAESI